MANNELSSYVVQMRKEDPENVIFSKYVRFTVYALQSIYGKVCVFEIPVFILNEHIQSNVYSVIETNRFVFRTGINSEKRVVFY